MAVKYHKSQVSTIGAVNNELEKIQVALEDAVSREGDGPNQLEATLDANSQRIINLPAPQTGAEPMRHIDGQQYVDQASLAATNSQAYRDQAEKFADDAEGYAQTASQAAATAAQDAAEAAVADSQVLLAQYVDDAQYQAGLSLSYANSALNYSNTSMSYATQAAGSAQQADSHAEQLSSFIDDYVSSGLMFPLDLGFVGDEINNSFDLGELP